MKVSIIIVNYNTLHVILPCIDSIVTHTKDIDYEIIVVDNGSTDHSIETLHNDPRLTLIAVGKNIGFGKANNLGLTKAKGECIFFLNADTLLKNNAIKLFYDFANQYQGRLGAIGCMLEDKEGNTIHSYGSFPKMSHAIQKLLWIPILKALRLYHPPLHNKPANWMKVDYITGADLFVSKKVLDECGAFHPAFFMYFEEVEMERRFMLHGYDNVVINRPRIIHLEEESSNDGKTSRFIRDTVRQQYSEYLYFKLTEPTWKYILYRILHPVLRQTVWFNPNVSLSDKWLYVKQLFVTVKTEDNEYSY